MNKVQLEYIRSTRKWFKYHLCHNNQGKCTACPHNIASFETEIQKIKIIVI